MSPQFSAIITDNTSFASHDDGCPGNPCSAISSVADIACAANMEFALHKIESESSATPANPLVYQACDENTSLSRKRSSARISTSPKNQPFLSSYGSAFLSGIFADIAEASDDQPQHGSAAAPDCAVHATASSEPCTKKARTTASTSFGRQSNMALAGLVEGADYEVSPSVVSPRLNMSTQKIEIQVFNDQVRVLQDMAFPSLPQLPMTVSSSSCSSASTSCHATSSLLADLDTETSQDDQDSPSFGWFVSTDSDGPDNADEQSATPTFLPDTAPLMFLPATTRALAFKTFTTPSEANEDFVVQQALAADTIDDVLGDLF